MSNSIPLNIGTLKDRKSRQEQADADLKLQILNSNRLARASRDYWINNETPINSQPDYTTNEILNDRNKLLKILANDVKSMLDKEQFTIFMADNTWNNLNVLRIAVQIFPNIKKDLGKNLRLLTANFLINVIANAVAETGYREQARQQERQQNEDENQRNDNPDEEDYYDFGEQNNNGGRNEIPARPRVPDGYYENADGEWIKIPRKRDDMEESSGDYRGNQRRDDMENSREDREGRYYYDESSSSSGRNNMRRADSANSERTVVEPYSNRANAEPDSQPSVEDFDLIPEPTDPAEKTFKPELLREKIDQLQSIKPVNDLGRIYSKLLYSENPNIYRLPGTGQATKDALNIIRLEKIARYPDAPPEQLMDLMREVARQMCAEKLDDLYRNGPYDFPEQPEKFNYRNFYGYGIKGKQRKGTKYGKGMAIQEMKGVSAPVKPDRSELYYSFGVFAVHKKSLGDNILNLKYKSFSQVHKYPKRQISDDLRDILIDAIETKKINNKLFNALTDSDKSFLTELVNEAKLRETFPNIFKLGNGIAINEPALERWEIVKGEFLAGNSNAEIKKEMRVLINQFMKQKLISAQEGFGILEML